MKMVTSLNLRRNKMPNKNNEKTWKDIFAEEDGLKRKIELITLRNITDALILCAEKADSFEKFAANLKLFRDKMEEEIKK